jgi:16S rRNA (adenine1518-N6/adenine1519-N6)-dimethyltransferase
MVQKEMAQRICANPPDMSILAVSVQVYAKPEIISYVPRSSFWPEPEVDSAIIRIKSHEARITNTETERDAFFESLRRDFQAQENNLLTTSQTD